jgi:hypothetical protein
MLKNINFGQKFDTNLHVPQIFAIICTGLCEFSISPVKLALHMIFSVQILFGQKFSPLVNKFFIF